MTQIEFDLIKERLTQWREDRHLTYESQQEGFLGNVFEEVSEYFRAKNDLERIDALCDIAVFCFNAYDIVDYHYYCEFCSNNDSIEIYNLTDEISEVCYKGIENLYVKASIPRIISYCRYLCKNLGFDFYKCMIETIKEIESRMGHYDDELKKFVKDEGAYSVEDVIKKYPKNKYTIDEYDKSFIVFNKKGFTECFILKWYKANYERCKL